MPDEFGHLSGLEMSKEQYQKDLKLGQEFAKKRIDQATKSTLNELKNLTRNSKKMGEVFSSINDLPLSLLLTMRIQGRFWEMLDKDFKKKIDNESIHEIFSLVFRELNEEQLINILNQIEPDGLLKIHQQIKERKDEKEALAYLEDVDEAQQENN